MKTAHQVDDNKQNNLTNQNLNLVDDNNENDKYNYVPPMTAPSMDYKTFNSNNLIQDSNNDRPYTTINKIESSQKEYEKRVEKSLLENNK